MAASGGMGLLSPDIERLVAVITFYMVVSLSIVFLNFSIFTKARESAAAHKASSSTHKTQPSFSLRCAVQVVTLPVFVSWCVRYKMTQTRQAHRCCCLLVCVCVCGCLQVPDVSDLSHSRAARLPFTRVAVCLSICLSKSQGGVVCADECVRSSGSAVRVAVLLAAVLVQLEHRHHHPPLDPQLRRHDHHEQRLPQIRRRLDLPSRKKLYHTVRREGETDRQGNTQRISLCDGSCVVCGAWCIRFNLLLSRYLLHAEISVQAVYACVVVCLGIVAGALDPKSLTLLGLLTGKR